jgi:hypothetical protein
MHLAPHESDNWDEFDLLETMKEYFEEFDTCGQDMLYALIQALVNAHRLARLEYPGKMPPSLLQAVEALLAREVERNRQTYQQHPRGEALSETDYVAWQNSGQMAEMQGWLRGLLGECMTAVGAEPVREAA